MTAGLDQFFNLPPLDEVLKDKGIDVHASKEPKEDLEPEKQPSEEDIQKAITNLRGLTSRTAMLEGTDHTEAMDTLHDEIVQHARDLMTYGYNIDMPRQRGIFEIAMAAYGHAMNAKNSKRDAQIKALRLELDQRKIDLEEKRTNHLIGIGNEQAATINDGTIVVEDRNELIKRLREQIKKSD